MASGNAVPTLQSSHGNLTLTRTAPRSSGWATATQPCCRFSAGSTVSSRCAPATAPYFAALLLLLLRLTRPALVAPHDQDRISMLWRGAPPAARPPFSPPGLGKISAHAGAAPGWG